MIKKCGIISYTKLFSKSIAPTFSDYEKKLILAHLNNKRSVYTIGDRLTVDKFNKFAASKGKTHLIKPAVNIIGRSVNFT